MECPICLESVENGIMLFGLYRNIPDLEKGIMNCCECNVSFHVECLKKWYKKSNTCPNCRIQHKEGCEHFELVEKEKIYYEVKLCILINTFLFGMYWLINT